MPQGILIQYQQVLSTMQHHQKITYPCLGLAALLTLGAWQFPNRVRALGVLFEQEDPLSSKIVTLVPNSIQRVETFQVNDGAGNTAITLCGIKSFETTSAAGAAPHEHLQQLLEKTDGNLAMVSAQSGTDGSTLTEIFVLQPNSEEEIHLNTQLLIDGVAQLDLDAVDSCPNAAVLHQAANTL